MRTASRQERCKAAWNFSRLLYVWPAPPGPSCSGDYWCIVSSFFWEARYAATRFLASRRTPLPLLLARRSRSLPPAARQYLWKRGQQLQASQRSLRWAAAAAAGARRCRRQPTGAARPSAVLTMSKNPKGVNNVDFRRKWDKDEFREKAAERDEKVRSGLERRRQSHRAALPRQACVPPERCLPVEEGSTWLMWAGQLRRPRACPAHPSAPPLVPRRAPTLQEKETEETAPDAKLEAKKRKRQERDPLAQGLIVARANLKARDYQIDLANKLHKTQVGGWVGGRRAEQGVWLEGGACATSGGARVPLAGPRLSVAARVPRTRAPTHPPSLPAIWHPTPCRWCL